jgi:hypothetical protein
MSTELVPGTREGFGYVRRMTTSASHSFGPSTSPGSGAYIETPSIIARSPKRITSVKVV